MTLMDDVATLQARVADAHRAQARAAGALDNAKATLDAAREDLKRDFGVTTVEQATALLAELTAELQNLADQVAAQLDQTGA